MPKFIVTIHETRAYDFIVEAETAQAAREEMEFGEFDTDKAIDSRGLDAEVSNVEAVASMNPNPRYVIDGHEFEPNGPELFTADGKPNNDSDMLGDGTFPPFGIFDTEKQDYILPFYPTREAAEAALPSVILKAAP